MSAHCVVEKSTMAKPTTKLTAKPFAKSASMKLDGRQI